MADEFGKYVYFCWKVQINRDAIENTVVNPPIVEYRLQNVILYTFWLLSEEVYSMIMKSSNATCNLGPISTWLLNLSASE